MGKKEKRKEVSAEQQKKDKAQLLAKYGVGYNRKGQPYLVIDGNEDMPTQDILISIFAAVCICTLAFVCHVYYPSDYSEAPGHPEDGFHFQAQQKAFFVDAHMHVVFLIASCLFLPTIFKLRAIMRDRPAFNLTGIVFVWNMIASGLSGWAMYYVVPELVNMVKQWGVNGMLCRADYCWSHENIGIYVFVYQASKALEWIDTTLLALRKKPLIFLHLFHHIVTMVYCWHAAVYSSPVDCAGLWFAGMNLVVHFIMYGYYGLTALPLPAFVNFLKKFSFLITILQTSQMVMGIYVLGATIPLCGSFEKNWHGTLFCAGMYGTYLVLFSKMTVKKFQQCVKMSGKKKAKKA